MAKNLLGITGKSRLFEDSGGMMDGRQTIAYRLLLMEKDDLFTPGLVGVHHARFKVGHQRDGGREHFGKTLELARGPGLGDLDPLYGKNEAQPAMIDETLLLGKATQAILTHPMVILNVGLLAKKSLELANDNVMKDRFLGPSDHE